MELIRKVVFSKQGEKRDVTQMIQDTKKMFNNFRSQGRAFQYTEPLEILMSGFKYSRPSDSDQSTAKERTSKELKDQRERVPEYMEAYLQLEGAIKADIKQLEAVGVDKKVEQAKLRRMKEEYSKLIEEKNKLNNPNLKAVQRLPFFGGVLEGIGNMLSKSRPERSTSQIVKDSAETAGKQEKPGKIRDPMEALRQLSKFRLRVQDELVREKQAITEKLNMAIEVKKVKLDKTKFILMGLFTKMLENPFESL